MDATSGPAALIQRLLEAVNAHDLDAIERCFAPHFVNETPAHPARSFAGNDQVRRNWSQILGGVPDLSTRILRQTVDGDIAWTEWEMRGTRRDGAPHLVRGVSIFGADDGRFTWVRFYLEPVEQGGPAIDDAIRAQVGR
jgi:ketosteroid isomerase-like protein